MYYVSKWLERLNKTGKIVYIMENPEYMNIQKERLQKANVIYSQLNEQYTIACLQQNLQGIYNLREKLTYVELEKRKIKDFLKVTDK